MQNVFNSWCFFKIIFEIFFDPSHDIVQTSSLVMNYLTLLLNLIQQVNLKSLDLTFYPVFIKKLKCMRVVLI